MLSKTPSTTFPCPPHLWVKLNSHTQNKPTLVGSSSATKYSQLKEKKADYSRGFVVHPENILWQHSEVENENKYSLAVGSYFTFSLPGS